MKRTLVALALGLACLVPTISQAQTSLFAAETPVRATAVLTTSDVLSTTFTIPADAKAVHFYVNFTKGSLTSAEFAPAGAMSGNPAAAGYYKSLGDEQSVTVAGKYHIRVPRESFGAFRYAGIFSKGTGTPTGSDAVISVKFEL